MKEIINYNKNIFERIKHIDDYGNEYWEARELQKVLEYAQWRRFEETINRAKITCENSNYNVKEHFANVGKTIIMPKNANKIVNDYKLSRYACYLIVQNGDSRKEVIAFGSNIFCSTNKKTRIIRAKI